MATLTLTPQKATHLSDDDLFAALQAGESKAINYIYDRYIKLVRNVAFKIIGSLEEAEEIAQEVFLTLQQKKSYDAKRGSLRGFLTLMARSRALDQLRSQKSRLQRQQNWQLLMQPFMASVAPMEYVEREERSQVMRDALLHLSEPQQQTLTSFYFQGLSQAEIAQQFNRPLGTVKTHARQGVISLRSMFQTAERSV
jgi:RNA polymerase sigma-70 factor, ECF subfamily